MGEVFRSAFTLGTAVGAHRGEGVLQRAEDGPNERDAVAGDQGVFLVRQVRQVIELLVIGLRARQRALGEAVSGGAGVWGPGVGTQQHCVAAAGPESGAADEDGYADGLAGGDRGVCGGQSGGD